MRRQSDTAGWRPIKGKASLLSGHAGARDETTDLLLKPHATGNIRHTIGFIDLGKLNCQPVFCGKNHYYRRQSALKNYTIGGKISPREH